MCVCISVYPPAGRAALFVRSPEGSLTPGRFRARAVGHPGSASPQAGLLTVPRGPVASACSAGEGPGHHQVLPAAVQAGRLGVGAELRHRRAQQPLVPAPLHRECQLCPHVSQTYLFLSLLSLLPSLIDRSHQHRLSLSFWNFHLSPVLFAFEHSGGLGRSPPSQYSAPRARCLGTGGPAPGGSGRVRAQVRAGVGRGRAGCSPS